MKKINDPELEKYFRNLVQKLLGPEKTKVKLPNFIFINGLPFLAYTAFNEETKEYLIYINKKTKKMIGEKNGKKIVCAMLAHEIGHIISDMRETIILEEGTCFSLPKELEADHEALKLLQNIYKNPKKILLMQICFAEKTVVENKNATKKGKEVITSLAEKRRNALAD